MVSGADLIAEKMQYDTDHPVTNMRIGRIGRLHCQGREALCKRERFPVLAVVVMARPEPPERPHLIVDVVKIFGEIESGLPSRAGWTFGPGRVHQRPAQRGIELHLAVVVVVCVWSKGSQRTLDPLAAFVDERQLKPQGYGADRERYPDRHVVGRRKRQVEGCA